MAAQTADDIITRLVQAPGTDAATAVIAGVTSRALLLEVADLLHIDADGHALPWVRKAIVTEARA